MNTIAKVAASTVAAASVGVGVFVATMDDTQQTAAGRQAIDWSLYLPDLDNYLPAMPTVAVPDMTPPAIALPDTAAPAAAIPDAETPDAEVPTITAPEIERITLTLPATGAGEISAAVLTAARRMAALQELCRDRRSVAHDRSIASNESMDRWTQIYRDFAGVVCTKVPPAVRAPVRMISEVMLPKNAGQFATLRENLEYYRTRGYNAVLVTFDGSEAPSDLRNLVKYLRYLNWEVWFAFSGPERLDASVFVDPARLKDQLAALAEYSAGMILGWRRTSAHLLLQDASFMNYLSSCAREANPGLMILGEAYYGNTAEHPHEGQWGWGVNLPAYASGAVLCNFGYINVDAEAVCRKLAPAEIGRVPLFAVVVGQKPYYLTADPNGFSQEVNQAIKERIEAKFVAAGCRGTVTLQDDGRHLSSNNLSETLYRSLATERNEK